MTSLTVTASVIIVKDDRERPWLAAMSDEEIARCVESVLLSPELAGTLATVNDVVNHVEAKLGLELSHKAAFIRDHINLLRRPPPPPSASSPIPQLMFYQLPPGSVPFAFRFPPPGAAPGTAPVFFPAAGSGGAALHPLVQPQETVAVRKPLAGAGSRTSVPARIKRKRGPGGLTRLCGVSPVLQTIVGESVMPRTEIVKQLWAYIRKNNLQDPNNKRNIICNDELRVVLETDFTDIFKMNKQLAKHITPLEPTKDAGQDKKLKVETFAGIKSDAGPDPCPMVLSDALIEFFGTGETELLQSEAISRICEYIKDNHLEDPVNSKILCDPRLHQLFGCESLAASGVPEMLACHLSEKA